MFEVENGLLLVVGLGWDKLENECVVAGGRILLVIMGWTFVEATMVIFVVESDVDVVSLWGWKPRHVGRMDHLVESGCEFVETFIIC